MKLNSCKVVNNIGKTPVKKNATNFKPIVLVVFKSFLTYFQAEHPAEQRMIVKCKYWNYPLSTWQQVVPFAQRKDVKWPCFVRFITQAFFCVSFYRYLTKFVRIPVIEFVLTVEWKVGLWIKHVERWTFISWSNIGVTRLWGGVVASWVDFSCDWGLRCVSGQDTLLS